MKFTNLKISCECIFPIDNVAHVRSRKTFQKISVNFQNLGFFSVSKPRKPVFIFRTGPTITIYDTTEENMKAMSLSTKPPFN